ncbi:hypothetical protein JCM9279_004673 [Rhodotorula babjevae]
MPSTPPPEHLPAPSSSFLAHFSRSPPSTSTSSPSSPSAAHGSSSATRPTTRASAHKRARSQSTSTTNNTGIHDPTLVGPPPRVPLPPSAIHPPSHLDTRDRTDAYSHVPPGAQLMDPTGLTRIQSKPRRKIGTFEAWRIWYSSLTVGSMFEQWEVIFVHSVVLGLFILLGCALAYFPPHLAHVLERWRYYLSGSSDLA